jgi:type IV pilus assembly protein PilA
MSKLLRNSKKGFTLIELMIVVAIIGILAAIAIPNFLRFQLKAKTSEAKVNLAAIRTAEESYLAEFGSYVVASATPGATPGAQKGTFSGGGFAGFNTLGWSPEGQVFFQYGVDVDGTNVLAYTADALADIDGDMATQVWGYVHTDPAGNTLAGAGQNGCAAVQVGTSMNVTNTVGPCGANFGQSVF